MTSVGAIILDLDGTMVDTLGDFDAALNQTLSELGRPAVSREQIERMVGKGSEHLIVSALAAGGLSEEDARRLLPKAWDIYQQAYLAINGDHSAVYPGVSAGLAAMTALELPLACLTNKPRAFAVELLQKKGLLEHFGWVFGGDSFERKKPDPLPLIRTCEAMQCEPVRTVMIGDSRNDALAARGAGCSVWLVPYGYNHGEPISDVAADDYLSDLEDGARKLKAML
ncbi:HAD-IA family hydrolase [Hydrogenophaga sp. 5NK40-0174]|uniref:HAD-IA family hydrolase n=1 Tax=Hydrogenophaga sp. 5NK40-0174 TaxID=3127649 RepID=UPI00333F915F